MVRLLTPGWKCGGKSLKLERYTAVALVGTQPEALSNCLPYGPIPEIILDNHQSGHNGSAEVSAPIYERL
jgi:hypothetical protein